MSPVSSIGLFQAFGVECEYMVVDRESLAIRPVVPELFTAVAGSPVSDISRGDVAWSNELVAHVLEIKTNGPCRRLEEVPGRFHRTILDINRGLESFGCCLLPSAMHPWMNPATEMKLWPNEGNAIYEAFNRVFDCRGHGWANLQSCHLNLPFANDEEFGRLHAAVRLLLPILPALAASSPILEGQPTGWMDTRLREYRNNCRAIPSVTGEVIPEPVFNRRDYRRKVLQPMYRDVAPHDPEGLLQEEYLNARGAIARFQRKTIEIRVLDMQECPRADLAILQLIIRVLRELVIERWTDGTRQRLFPTERLATLLDKVMRSASSAVIDDPDYLEALGCGESCLTAGELWTHLFKGEACGGEEHADWAETIRVILREGCLARRILRALKDDASHAHQKDIYAALANSLAENRLWIP